jgi:D-methionine transport system ATP-binding protein
LFFIHRKGSSLVDHEVKDNPDSAPPRGRWRRGAAAARPASSASAAAEEVTAEGAADEVVRLEGVHRTYAAAGGPVQALRGVDLRVARGTIQGIIGFSGAGKSTLVRCLALLEAPDAGRVWIAGTEAASLRAAALRDARRRIGIVFQQYNLLRSRTVAQNVALPLELAGTPAAETRARVAELLRWVGLGDRADSYPAQLSGGQRQRVAVARALAPRPDVLLTDEPTSALDPETTRSVLALLRRVRDELGVTILLVTHEMASVRAVCDRVAVLDAGRIVEEGPTREVLAGPRSDAARRLLRTDAHAADSATPDGASARWELRGDEAQIAGALALLRERGIAVRPAAVSATDGGADASAGGDA